MQPRADATPRPCSCGYAARQRAIAIFLGAAAGLICLALPAYLLGHLAPPAGLLPASALLLIALAALTTTDLVDQRLPDALTLPLALAGLAFNAEGSLVINAAAAISCYGLLLALAWSFERIRGYPGFGLGDAKLMSAAAAWLGPEGAASVLLLASVLALLFVGLCSLRSVWDRGRRLPFGPFIAAGLWLVWLYGANSSYGTLL